MNKLTVFCSVDEESRVVAALDRVGVEGFVRLGGATGNRFLDPGQVPRTMSWEALMIVAPRLSADQVRDVVAELREYTRSCEVEPCLRAVVSEVTEVI